MLREKYCEKENVREKEVVIRGARRRRGGGGSHGR
jgi:hypothetical protein